MGAVYQAAALSKAFKVKPFMVRDAAMFPIQVILCSPFVHGIGKWAELGGMFQVSCWIFLGGKEVQQIFLSIRKRKRKRVFSNIEGIYPISQTCRNVLKNAYMSPIIYVR